MLHSSCRTDLAFTRVFQYHPHRHHPCNTAPTGPIRSIEKGRSASHFGFNNRAQVSVPPENQTVTSATYAHSQSDTLLPVQILHNCSSIISVQYFIFSQPTCADISFNITTACSLMPRDHKHHCATYAKVMFPAIILREYFRQCISHHYSKGHLDLPDVAHAS